MSGIRHFINKIEILNFDLKYVCICMKNVTMLGQCADDDGVFPAGSLHVVSSHHNVADVHA